MNKEQSIKQAIGHANQVHPEWSELAYEKCLLYFQSAKSLGIKEFQIYDLRKHIDTFFVALPQPPDNRSWGEIARKIVREGKVKIIGYKPTKNEKAHNTLAAIYEIL